MRRNCCVMLAACMAVVGCERKESAPTAPSETSATEPAPPPEPARVESPIELFNGQDFTGWKFSGRLNRKKWVVGAAAINPEKKQTLKAEPGGSDLVNTDIVGSDLVTEEKFRDFLLEFEFMLPAEGNSGVYLLGQYEIQVSHEPEADHDMAVGSIPRLVAPKEVVAIEPGTWHRYSIDFRAPRFDASGKKTENARLIRVTIDETVVHEDAEIPEQTVGAMQDGVEVPEGPILLQGSHTSVAFRKMVLTPRN